MGLLSFLKRKKTEAAPRGGSRATESVDSQQQARTRARRRLIGATVLVIAGVVGFPLIFETQPRPLSTDVPIEIVRKDAAPGAAQPARPAPTVKPLSVPPSVVVEPPPDAEKEAPTQVAVAPVVAPPPAPTPVAKPAEPEVKKVEEKKPEPKKVEEKKAAPKAVEVTTKTAPAPAKAASAPSRFVVQVGAFTDAAAVKEARQKVEKLGLTTYTQPVDSATGRRTRVRVGPFSSRDEAEKAAAKIKGTGLQTAVYTL